QYQSRNDAFSTVTRLTDSLVYEDIATFPEKTLIPATYDPEFISEFIQSLRAQTCVYFVLADPAKTGVLPDAKEQWMGAEYAIKKVPSSRLNAWNQMKPSNAIQLPGKNRFLPTDLALVEKIGNAATVQTPLLLVSNDHAQVYFAQDLRYQLPEIAAIFSFKSPLIHPDAKSQVLTDLYLTALNDNLSSDLFFASNAKINGRFHSDDLSIKLVVQGFSNKASVLLHEIFRSLQQILPSEEMFDLYSESLSSDYANASKELPLRQANEIMDHILFDQATNAEKHEAIRQITYQEFTDFCKQLFAKVYTQAFLYGNLTIAQANQLCQDLNTTLSADPYPLSEQAQKKVLILSDQFGPYMLCNKTQRQGNAVTLLIEEGSFTFEKRASQQILGSILGDAFFDTLRTKQQTAYIAKAFAVEKE
ncbi:MAG: insulinase family protein, partial [Chlamydiales bacterium]|nr:insulinase family protein [Chlamydiales bacterium]